MLTAALDPHRGEIVGVSLAVAPILAGNNGYDALYIPLGHHDPDGAGFNAEAGAPLRSAMIFFTWPTKD
ncbi:MAG: hypothetical protein CVU99_00890 [Firmicutes bacterium HGW-Firmicutes-4]|nr:MAG: hypothetical protein CVU99_00890 [Firmicutes bacterium HGW-Firmicutes-4]